MIITLLGTGTSQGVPVIGCECDVCQSLDYKDKRLRSAIHIFKKQTSIVIDTGPDFRQQMLNNRIKQLDAVIFTHQHKDHTAGADDIRSYNFLQNRDMPVYGTKTVIAQLKQEFAYAFTEKKYPGVPQIKPVLIENKPFEIQNITLTPIEGLHYKLPVFGYRIENFSYITDMNFIDKTEMKKLIGTEYLIINALQKQPHISHFTLQQALNIIKMIKPRNAWLTHISHKLGKHHSVNKELPKNVSLAYDGMKIEIND